MRRVLVLNAGSSSLKWSVLAAADTGAPAAEAPLAAGTLERTGNGSLADPIGQLLGEHPARQVDAIGHRIVHGGAAFREGVRITAEVRQALGDLAEVDPLHTAAALAGVDAVTAAAPDLPQVAAFDTSFHATLSAAAAIYPLPYDWTERFALRRYGFHGLSVSWAVRRIAQLTGATPERLVVCHLGSGCSVTAVRQGRSVDTSMGFTPLDGMMMATRSGAIDPGLLLHLGRRCGLSLDELDDGLQHHAGLAGVSGVSGDLRQVLAAADAGDAAGDANPANPANVGARRAALAYQIFVHSLVRTTGALIAVLGGVDHLVLTGGIGEHSARLRADFLGRLDFLGLRLDPTANASAGNAPADSRAGHDRNGGADREISLPASAFRVHVITAREDLEVLREVRRVLGVGGAPPA